jgi:stage II sporulation protein D
LAQARDVTVRLYSNQAPARITLVRDRKPSPVQAGGPPLLVTGAWEARLPDQEPLALAYPLAVKTESGGLTLTVTLPLEEYVAAVLAGEAIGFRSPQSLAAMAVAARTYAVRFTGRHKSAGYDFCDTTHCQDLRIGAVQQRLRQAAGMTESELLWFEGAPAAAFYTRDCGGASEAAAHVWPDMKAPYLRYHQDPHCRGQAGWKSSIGKQDLRAALAAAGIRLPARLDSLRIAAHTPSGRAWRLETGGRAIQASALRFAAGRAIGWTRVPSDLYELSDSGDRFLFEGRGSGHGVGLCQAGAARMGEDGRGYREILEFYYPGTKLGVSAQGFSWQSLSGERVEVLTTRPAEDGPLVALADRIAQDAERRTGLRWETVPKLRIYPTVSAFRDATGEPGWVAASTRGGQIRLQPPAALRARGALESAVRHELFHALVEDRARPGPLWFREGAVLYLTGSRPAKSKSKPIPPQDSMFLRSREEAQRAYAAAAACFSELVDRYGESQVLAWLNQGLPRGDFQ